MREVFLTFTLPASWMKRRTRSRTFASGTEGDSALVSCNFFRNLAEEYFLLPQSSNEN